MNKVFQTRKKRTCHAHLILPRSQSDLVFVQLNLLSNGNIPGTEKSILNYFALKKKKNSF